MLGSLASALLIASGLGPRLGVAERVRVLVGVGTGICGASAIAAVSGIVDATESEIRHAISTIFAFNLVAVVVFPPLGHLFGMSQHAFGLWSGTAVNDTSSVLAAGFAYGQHAGTYAIIVKLTRTTMIIPISLALAWAVVPPRVGARTVARDSDTAVWRRGLMPWFVLWFLAATMVDSLGALDAGARAALSHAGLALTTVALAAVGLSTGVGEMRRAGVRPLALGALVWVTVTSTSLGLAALIGVL
jgi:uncharacterized integral membrane protein (TIGR00698 family)